MIFILSGDSPQLCATLEWWEWLGMGGLLCLILNAWKRFWCGCTPFLPLYLQPLGCHLPSTAWNCILVCWLLVTTWADISPIVFSCSQFIPIDVFSSSDHRVIYFRMMRPFSFGYGVYIISLFTPAHLDPSFKVVSFLDLSLLFFHCDNCMESLLSHLVTNGCHISDSFFQLSRS